MMANIKPIARTFMRAPFSVRPMLQLRRISLGRCSLLVLRHIAHRGKQTFF